jgi:hypothetical protein
MTITLAVTFKPALSESFQIYAYVGDKGGLQDLWKAIGSWSPATAPQLVSVYPATGSGLSRLFTFTFSDAGGYERISVIGIAFGANLTFVGSCFLNYTSAGIFLMNDGGTAWLPPRIPGSGGALENSRCAIDLAESTVTGTGSTLTISLAMRFKAALGSSLKLYTYISNVGGQQELWRSVGAWTAQ